MSDTTPTRHTPEQFWAMILDDLQLQMTRAAFATWLKPTRAIGYANGALSVQVPSQATKEWLENRLNLKIQETVDYFATRPLQIRYVTDHATSTSPAPARSQPMSFQPDDHIQHRTTQKPYRVLYVHPNGHIVVEDPAGQMHIFTRPEEYRKIPPTGETPRKTPAPSP